MSAAVASSLNEKRPLNLNNSDEETEDEDQQAKAAKEKELIMEADDLVVKKKARHSKPFTEDILTLPDGLQRIYEEFPKACKFRGRGSEAKDIKKLMNLYREWAFQLHPGLAFTDMVSKCEVLGTKGKTRSCIQNLRDNERTRYIAEVLDASKNNSTSPITVPTSSIPAVPESVPPTRPLAPPGSTEEFTSPEDF